MPLQLLMAFETASLRLSFGVTVSKNKRRPLRQLLLPHNKNQNLDVVARVCSLNCFRNKNHAFPEPRQSPDAIERRYLETVLFEQLGKGFATPKLDMPPMP